ncbi:hypothetical protein F5I97DRAFT_1809179 [Phlebopus sp. FC_14]|nr:hypothetical protein F5I97DRAFT_1809179 [Phlebopus sp. FC_14]
MGSSLSTIISPGTVLVAIVTGATVYGYCLYTNAGTLSNQFAVTNQPSSTSKPSKAKKKKQAAKNTSPSAALPFSVVHHETPASSSRQKGKSVASVEPAVIVSASHRVIPGEFEVAAAAAKQKNKKNNNKKEKEKSTKGTSPDTDSGRVDSRGAVAPHGSYAGDVPAAGTSGTPSEDDGHVPADRGQGVPPQQSLRASPSSVDKGSSWTRVETHRQKASKSKVKPSEGGTPTLVISTEVTTSDVGTSTTSPLTGRSTDEELVVTDHETRAAGGEIDNKRRTLAEKLLPKPPKTGVQDMLERPDFPTLARVMRVQPRPGETPAPGFTWEDYEDVDQGPLHVHDVDQEGEGEWDVVKGKNRSRSISISASTSTPPVQQASETMTKKQRQNAKKRELMKAAKAEAEATRLAGLAKHKRELERQRIIELSREGGGKRPSGGMQASVDHRGKLVWE